MRQDPSARVRVAAATVGLLALGVGAAQADYRATGEFAGFVCESGGCKEARFDDATVPGNFRLKPGAVFAAVTGHDAEAGTCRIDLADPALAEAAAPLSNLTRAKFYTNSHDGQREVAVTTLRFACVVEE